MSSMLGLIKDKLKIGSSSSRSSPSSDALPLPPGFLCLSSSHDGLLRVWDERGRCALTLAGHEKAVYTVVNLPDGRVASGGYDHCIRVWNLKTGRCENVVKAHSDSIFCLKVFFNDREGAIRQAALAATAAAINQQVSSPGSSTSSISTTARPVPAFRLISSSSDKTIKVWNGATYKCEQTLQGHTGSILSIVQVSDTLLATGSLDKTIRVWNLERNRCELTMSGHLSSVSGLAVLDDNTKIASCSYDETIKIWSTFVPGPGGNVPESTVAPAGPNELPASFNLEKSIRGHTSAIMNILHLPATHQFPQRLVTCSRDLNIKVWSVPVDANGNIGSLRCISNITSHRNDINNLCVLSDARTLVSCSSDCMIKTFDLEKTGNITTSELSINNTNQDGKGYTVYSVCPIPDSKRSLRRSATNVAVEEWEEVPHPLEGHGPMSSPQSKPTPRKQTGVIGMKPMAVNTQQQPQQPQNMGMQNYDQDPNSANLGGSRPISRISSQNALDQMKDQSNQNAAAVAPVSSPSVTAGDESPVSSNDNSLNNSRVRDDVVDDSDIDEDERNAKPLILKPDCELDPSLRRVIQKYRLKHYLNYGHLLEEGFYDDGGVVFVTTSHVPKTTPSRPPTSSSSSKPPQAAKINLNSRLSYASNPVTPATPPVGGQPNNNQQLANFPSQSNPAPTPTPSSTASNISNALALSSSSTNSSTATSTTFKPYKQWTEETIVLDARFDVNLRSTTEEAKRLLAGVSDMKARIMLLALFVSNKLGGSPKDIVKEWQTTIAKLRKVYGRVPPSSSATPTPASRRLVLPIGSLIGRVGLSRHRALLFKYLCDQTVLFPENWAPPVPQPPSQQRHISQPSQPSPRISPLPPASPPPLVAQSSATAANAGASSAPAPSHFNMEPIDNNELYSPSLASTGAGGMAAETEEREKLDRLAVPSAMAHFPPPILGQFTSADDDEVERTNREHQAPSTGPSTAEHSRPGSRDSRSSSVEAEEAAPAGSHLSLNVPGVVGGGAVVGGTSSHPNSPHRPVRQQSGNVSTDLSSPPSSSSSNSGFDPTLYPSIHCRLMRGQYEYHFPRSAARSRKIRSTRSQRTWEESWEDQEAGYSRHQDAAGSSKTYHAWVVVELWGNHYVVDLSYEPSQLYLESSKEAAHYNRGRLGDVKKTGLTSAPLRSLHEIAWHELTDIVLLRDGGFGRVEKAKYRGLEVVVKTPLSLDSYILKTFMEEAQVLNLLSHPNIVKLVGVCTEKKAIVLDFVQGGDLHTFLKTQAALAQQYQTLVSQGQPVTIPYTPLTMLDRLDMCIQIAIGMMYLHWCEPMITHRDLKTLNLLVSTVKYHPDELSPTPPPPSMRSPGFVQKRVIKVCDFGLARNQHHDDGISTQHKDVGTPAFQSPEQWRDDEEERLTTATDVYSFGGIMMEILTDRMPWCNEKSKYAIYQHVMVEKRLPPIPADANLHPKLIEIIDSCHQFEPAARPAFPDVLRVLREVSDELEDADIRANQRQLQSVRVSTPTSPHRIRST